jgi:hypothetical protein
VDTDQPSRLHDDDDDDDVAATSSMSPHHEVLEAEARLLSAQHQWSNETRPLLQ